MKTSLLSLFAAFAMQAVAAYAFETPDQMVNEFGPLISRTRGFIRQQLQEGQGCLPAAYLAQDSNVEKTMVPFGFNQEIIQKLGGTDAKTVGAFIGIVANKGSFNMSAIGTCEKDATIGEGSSPNVIQLILERRNGLAIKLRFPFVQDSKRQVSYIESKATMKATEPLVFSSTAPNNSQESIAVDEQGQFYNLTVPVSKLAIRIPKGGFQRKVPTDAAGSRANPRYFSFNDPARGILISGWFESASRFQGVKDNPPGVVNGQTTTHQNVLYKKIGKWDVVSYEVSVGSFSNAHLSAHLVQANTWVELHLSADPKRSLERQHALLDEVLLSIQSVDKQ